MPTRAAITAVGLLIVCINTAFAQSGPAVSFYSARTFGFGDYTYSVAVGDFNKDGNPDLVKVNSCSSNISLLLGNGDGTFQPDVNYRTGQNPRSVAVGDFNSDGKLDVAVADYGNSDGGDVSVLLGKARYLTASRNLHGRITSNRDCGRGR